MALPDLLPLLTAQPWFADALRRMDGGERTAALPGLSVAARPFVEAAAAAARGKPTLVITSRPDRAEEITEAIGAFLPPDTASLFLWRTPDALPYETLPRDP